MNHRSVNDLGLVLLLAICVLFSSGILVSCQDIIEKDISSLSVSINSPNDSMIFNTPEVTFWWEEMNGATSYELMVVSPSFDTIQSFPVDTIVSKTKYVNEFPVGRYHWRIRALNGAYKSQLVFRSFEVR